MTLRKAIILLLTAAMLLGLCACGGFVSIMPGTELVRPDAAPADDETAEAAFSERPLLPFLGLDTFAESYYSDTPVALSYQPVVGEDGSRGCRSYVFDRASIIAACDALRSMYVTERTEEEAVSEAEFILTMTGGTEHVFSLNTLADGTRVVSTSTGNYRLRGGDELWAIAFPAYSPDFDLFDLYFSDDVRAFADNFYANRPVSIGYRLSSGATITSSDSDLIEQVFRALSGATVTVVENYPDQNVDLNQLCDYIFTMEDGTAYTFSFAQRCLAVKAVSGFDTVYYWMGGLAPLWDIEIRSENSIKQFEGGTVADLRDDIGQTAQVVNAGDGEITVAGVFVEYTIGEETGYLTLSDELAVSFLRQVLSVPVSVETEEEPSGARITVSVTLSDLSGPILYFTGDTIQQVVGLNYVCGAEDMFALRSTILELAAEGNNDAEISEGGTD